MDPINPVQPIQPASPNIKPSVSQSIGSKTTEQPVQHKQKLLKWIIVVFVSLSLIFIYCSIPKFIVTPYLISTLYPINGIAYKVENFGGCASELEQCTNGKMMTYFSNDSAEKIFKLYNTKLTLNGWKETMEGLHFVGVDAGPGYTYSYIQFEKDIFTQHYTISITKMEASTLNPNKINQVSVRIFYPAFW